LAKAAALRSQKSWNQGRHGVDDFETVIYLSHHEKTKV